MGRKGLVVALFAHGFACHMSVGIGLPFRGACCLVSTSVVYCPTHWTSCEVTGSPMRNLLILFRQGADLRYLLRDLIRMVFDQHRNFRLVDSSAVSQVREDQHEQT
jgi:hypothetical protein